MVRSFAGSADPRFLEVMSSLVRHLHAFARDVRLTEEEWQHAIDFLTRTGQICTPTRQEFILLSDVLGLSMMTVGINSPGGDGITEDTVFGPFFVQGSPRIDLDGDVAADTAGPPCHLSGRVLDQDGNPVAGARIEVWEADEDGFYDVQYDHGELRGRGHLFTDDEGRYGFWSVVPAPYGIPSDGPVGELLTAAGRSPMRPAHVHFMITAEGHRRLITHLFVADGPHLSSDAVFGVKPSLVVPFARHDPDEGPGGRQLADDWYSAVYDFTLARETTSTAPIENPPGGG
ncbi:dioxygenase [Pseudonocardia lutea]|uniref:Dioxygenase n=1 Tax=Pseudonocardia lutea TaxID=2172015 RepID=A0ABW1I2V2_9PSEU